jgi:hypothetical protein
LVARFSKIAALLLLGLGHATASQAEAVLYRGVVCKQVLVTGTSMGLDDYLGMRLKSRSNFNYGGVDWAAYNKAQNSQITNWSELPSGTRLNLYTPKIPGVATNATAVCQERDVTAQDLQPHEVPVTAQKGAPAESETAPQSRLPRGVKAPPKVIVAQRAFNASHEQKQDVAEEERLEDTAFASHFGLRYGLPLVANSVLLPKTRLVNIFAQIKSGALDGLTIFADDVPSVSEKQDDTEFTLGWQRTTVGWAFGYEPPRFIRRIEFAPRLGYWRINAKLPQAQDGGGLAAVNFGFSRFSLGFELSAAVDGPFETSLRVWHARDIALSGSGGGGASSQRLGIDVFTPGKSLTIGKKKFDLLGLVYLMHDAMFMTEKKLQLAKLASPEGVSAPGQTDQVYYGLFYFGAGMTVTF